MTAGDPYLKHVINTLRDNYELDSCYPNHCTGEHAYLMLANAFGDKVNPYPVGTVVNFED